MTTLTEGYYAGHFLVSEAGGRRSRDVITLASNGSTTITLQAGTVLAKVTASGKFVLYDNVGSDGTEVAAAILYDTVVVPATGDLKATAILRDAEVNAAELQYDSGIADLAAAKTGAQADLLTAGIIFR